MGDCGLICRVAGRCARITWGACITDGGDEVPELPFVGDVFEEGVIGDDVAFETHAEAFSEAGIGIQEETFAIGRDVDEDVGFDLAFEIGDAGVEGGGAVGGTDVVGDLAVEVADTVCPREAPFGPAGKMDAGTGGEHGLIKVGGHGMMEKFSEAFRMNGLSLL